MRRFLAIVLLALLPLQFSWAAVASYCQHETQGAGHVGHHGHDHHAHHAVASSGAGPAADLTTDASPPLDATPIATPIATPNATPNATSSADGIKAPGAVDFDCGHCHGICSALLIRPLALPGAPSTAPPRASLDEAGAAHAPTRPERPQWLPLA